MSKLVKQMQMTALAQSLGGVRDMVLLSMTGVPAQVENQMRLSLRKKSIRMQLVKNSLASRVLKDNGIGGLDNFFNGPTVLAWSTAKDAAVSELAKALDEFVKKYSKQITTKTAVADGNPVPFETAKKLPTRAEALSALAAAVLGPGAQLAAATKGPGGALAGAVKSLEDKKEEPAPAAT